MIGVVIVAHGGLAREYLLAVEHVVGKQSDMQAISIEDDCDRDKKQAEICAAANAVDHGEGVVVVTDMFGGSPSNLSLMAGCAGSALALLALAMAGQMAAGAGLIQPATIALGLFNGMFAVAAIGSMMALAGEGREARESARRDAASRRAPCGRS